MINSHEVLRTSSPTVDAYDGHLLELLENPEALPPSRDGSAGLDGPAFDGGPNPWGAPGGPVG